MVNILKPTPMSEDFLEKLQNEAELQSRLEKSPLLPRKIGGLLSFVALHPWQFLLVISGVTALVVFFV